MDDLQARLDRAIVEARDTVLCAPDVYEVLRPAVDRLSALVALRAQLAITHEQPCYSQETGEEGWIRCGEEYDGHTALCAACEPRARLNAECDRLIGSGEDA